MKYPQRQEQITVAGLGGVGGGTRKRGRRKVCASDRHEYAWLRMDPCMELPDADELARLEPVTNSASAVKYLRGAIAFEARAQEHFVVLLLDTKNVPLGLDLVGSGGTTSMSVDPRLALQGAVLISAVGIILAHNHPSGEPSPSRDDESLTKRMIKAGELVGVTVLDHIVLGLNTHFSFRDAGLMDVG